MAVVYRFVVRGTAECFAVGSLFKTDYKRDIRKARGSGLFIVPLSGMIIRFSILILVFNFCTSS